jgi:hypothetical protein
MATSEDYKRQVMKDLSHGNVESLDDSSSDVTQDYQNFDDFAQRTSRDQRHQLFKKSLHPDQIPSSQMEPELQKAIAQIKPNERDDVAREFLKHLKGRGLSDRALEQQLKLSTHHPSRVLADQPALFNFLGNPLVGAVLGAVAAKWLGNRK